MSDIQNKVKAILKQAEDPNIGEAEAMHFLSMASKLCMRYNLDLMVMQQQAKNDDKPVKPIYKDIMAFNPFSVGKTSLLSNIARAFGGAAVIHRSAANNQLQNGAIIRVFAYPADLDQIEVIYCSTLIQGVNGKERLNRMGYTSRGAGASYWAGFARGVSLQLEKDSKETIAEAEAKNPGTALVLAERNKLVKRELHLMYPSLRTVTRTITSAEGYYAGKRDGQSALIESGRSIQGRRAISR